MKPKVSVIIPTYNRADLIVQAIDSVLAQNYQPIEIIVIDDGSTDDTQAAIRKYTEINSLIFLRQCNQGQSVARNLGLDRASGDFVCFLDSDNAWLPNKLSTQADCLSQHPEIDVVYGDIRLINQNGDDLGPNTITRYSGYIWRELLTSNCVSMNTVMLRRKALPQQPVFDPTLRAGEDYDLWLRIATTSKFKYLRQEMALYRIEGNRVSNNDDRAFSANLKSIREFFSHNSDKLSSREQRRILATFFRQKSYFSFYNGNPRAGLIRIIRSLYANPFNLAGWKILIGSPYLIWKYPRSE